MLKYEFLDVNYTIDETYKNILKTAPTGDFGPYFTLVKIYINEIKPYLYELKAHKIDLLKEGTAGHSFTSHVIFNKLPMPVKRELVHRLSDNCPSITDIFSNYN